MKIYFTWEIYLRLYENYLRDLSKMSQVTSPGNFFYPEQKVTGNSLLRKLPEVIYLGF